MSDPDDTPLRPLSDHLKAPWHSFLDVYEPLRPELYRFCRYLTRSPWDAEDLVQDTLARAFVTLGTLYRPPPNPRAWMFRVASNLWIDRSRRAREVLGLPAEQVAPAQAAADRDAASALIGGLSPQERAAVVLKDVFGHTLEEIAEALSTTVGAVKAALHRGRGKLAEPVAAPEVAPSRQVLDAFCDAFNARDIERLTALLLDNSVVEVLGAATEYGPDAASDPETGSFAGSLASLRGDGRGGLSERYLDGYIPVPPRAEVRQYRGESIVLFWYAHESGEAVRGLGRLAAEGDRIARLRFYFFTQDVLAEVCRELRVPFRVNGYRFW
jgi:RNA polymerase sigma-70 factor (ECF subfamily)